MNSTYLLTLALGAVLCAGLFAWRAREVKPALIALPLTIVLGGVMAKLLYFVTKLPEQIDNYGIGGILRTRPAEFSFVGGAVGVVVAILITAKLLNKPAFRLLDAFAPCGALMAAIIRACEGLLDPMSMVGLGDFVADPKWQTFPFAMENAMFYSWFYAIFMMEAALALIVALVGFLVKSSKPGRIALQTALFLALPQIFSERMLNQCIRWGFVRMEQLLCAVIVFGVILYGCVKAKNFLPALLDFLCVAVLIWMEFTLDNKLLFGIELAPTTCYMVQIGSLCVMALLAQWAFFLADKKKA